MIFNQILFVITTFQVILISNKSLYSSKMKDFERSSNKWDTFKEFNLYFWALISLKTLLFSFKWNNERFCSKPKTTANFTKSSSCHFWRCLVLVIFCLVRLLYKRSYNQLFTVEKKIKLFGFLIKILSKNLFYIFNFL